jgi:hypothetical protein
MAYSQDTITSANAANDFAAIVKGLLIDAGWTLVEENTPSGNLRNAIYKSSGLLNECGYDWYVAVMYTTLGTENFVRVIPFENYDEVSNIASGFPVAFDIDPTTGGSPGGYKSARANGLLSSNTLNLATVGTGLTAFLVQSNVGSSSNQYNNAGPGFQTLIPSSAFGYWASVTLDHVALWTTIAANVQGAVMSTIILDADYVAEGLFSDSPIVCWTGQQAGTGMTGHFQLSSHLAVGINPTTTEYVALGATFSNVYGAKLPALSDTYLDAYAWQPLIYLSYMIQGSGAATPTTALRGQIVVGRVPDFLMVWGGSIGDTVTVDGATYVLTGPFCGNFPTDGRPTLALLVE